MLEAVPLVIVVVQGTAVVNVSVIRSVDEDTIVTVEPLKVVDWPSVTVTTMYVVVG